VPPVVSVQRRRSAVVAQDDLVVFMTTWRGTQTGAFMGIPPTGKQVAWKVFDTIRVVDGKCVEHWGLMDQMSLMQQLGVIPTPEAAS
jgi:predicted ester cyclase